jgi:hypothetical protein
MFCALSFSTIKGNACSASVRLCLSRLSLGHPIASLGRRAVRHGSELESIPLAAQLLIHPSQSPVNDDSNSTNEITAA